MGNIGSDKDVIFVKASLLCHGLRPTAASQHAYLRQNPYGDWKTGNVGLHLLLGDCSAVLATVEHHFDRLSEFRLEEDVSSFSVVHDDGWAIDVAVIDMPRWYEHAIGNDRKASEILLHEGRHFLHDEYLGCDFFRVGKQCAFCATGPDWQIPTPEEIASVVALAVAEDPDYQVCLGGGTRLPAERDLEYFASCARTIRRSCPDVPIFVEMVPPPKNSMIKELASAGATSFGFNMEIWDDELRREICPGKDEISKARYLSALEYGLRLLGGNRVGSCLIVGLEPLESTLEGIATLAAQGIQPCLLPFKPWNGSQLANHPRCEPELALEAAKGAAEEMLRFGIDPDENHGCLNCEGCTLEHDILKNLRRKEEQ